MCDENGRKLFEALYATHYKAVWAYVARRVGRNAADDITAETFLVAWRKVTDVPGNALPWLYTVAWNTIANHRRAQAKGAALVSRLNDRELPALSDPTDSASNASGDPRLTAALKRLSELELEVLMLVGWEGLEVRQVAKVLGCSSATAAARLYRARRKLRKELSSETVGEPGVVRLVVPQAETQSDLNVELMEVR